MKLKNCGRNPLGSLATRHESADHNGWEPLNSIGTKTTAVDMGTVNKKRNTFCILFVVQSSCSLGFTLGINNNNNDIITIVENERFFATQNIELNSFGFLFFYYHQISSGDSRQFFWAEKKHAQFTRFPFGLSFSVCTTVVVFRNRSARGNEKKPKNAVL